jgi:hypothetical protein
MGQAALRRAQALSGAVAVREASTAPAPLLRLAHGRLLPLVLAAFTSLTTAWTWGGIRAVPVSHDEAAYVLQARIFAGGHWTAPARPHPEFFEQTHVFVTPVLAAKYPPGHSLALVPGIFVGLPGLVPVLMTGLAGALLFLLARRFAGPLVAVLAWWIWLTAPGAIAFRASYLSESTSSALWLLGWWLLVRWRESGRGRDLVLLAACTGFEFLTRPLTMVAFGIPVGVIVLRQVWSRRAWGQAVWSVAVGSLFLAVVPLWSYRTLGNWRTTPYRQYSRVYYPYQWTGFTFDATAPLRPHPPEMDEFDRTFREIQHKHRTSQLPAILAARLKAIGNDVWGVRPYLMIFAAVGLIAAIPEVIFAVCGFAVLILAYLVFAHAPGWSVYYLEGQPVLAFLIALGLVRVLTWLTARLPRFRVAGLTTAGWVYAVFVLGLAVPDVFQLAMIRSSIRERLAYQAEFRSAVGSIPEKAIVFVRYAPGHDVHRELISNDPDLHASRAWIVYDRGARDSDLMRSAPERVPYLYDEAHRRLSIIRP